MRKIVLAVVAVGAIGGGTWYYYGGQDTAAATNATGATTPADGGGAAGGRLGGRGGRGAGLSAMTVETVSPSRHDIIDYVTVVGNLVGEATVDVTPRVTGRLDSVNVRLGDRVSKGDLIAKVEDREIREQVNQSEANLEVNRATVVSRENDVTGARNTFERTRASFAKGLVSQQNLEDAEARYNSAASQVTVAKAQLASTQARLDELKINLSNTNIVAPMDGMVGRRNLDPGAFAGNNTAVVSIVNLGTVRMVANLVEKDFRRVQTGAQAIVEVDAFPGEQFTGRVSRVAPVFDPATRTASMEIEVPNPGYRLKPGMYARVRLTAERRPNALTVPRGAVVDLAGKHGVFLFENDAAKFRDVRTGIADAERVEVLDGLDETDRVITVGALALRDGDRVLLTPAAGGAGGRAGGRAGGSRGRGQGQAAGAETNARTPATAVSGSDSTASRSGGVRQGAQGTSDATAAPRGRNGGARGGGSGEGRRGRGQNQGGSTAQ